MSLSGSRLADVVVARSPLEARGASGNRLERVTLADGRELVCKSVSPEWDWLSRATGDDGRALAMWEARLFDRMPAVIDHTTVAVEPDGAAWCVYMRDVSDVLLPAGRRFDRGEVRRVLAALAELHLTFWGESFPELCSLEQRYALLSPQTAERERRLDNPVGASIEQCWEAFCRLAPTDVAAAVLAIAERPAGLAAQLASCEQTLIHGDVRTANLGFAEDRVVLVDWGERTGTAPPAVELASFLAVDAERLDVSTEDVIADFRALYGDRFDERALHLALIGALVQLAPSFMLPVMHGGDDEAWSAVRARVAWWTAAASDAFDTVWSPL